MDAAQLGNRLRAARDRRGLSQQAVADALGLPRTAITNMETGARAVSTLEITKLADLYGQTPAYFLSPNEQEAEDLLVVLHRAAPGNRGDAGDQDARSVVSSISIERGPDCAAFSTKRPSKRSRTMQASCLSVGDAIRQGEVGGPGGAPAFGLGHRTGRQHRRDDQRPRRLDGGTDLPQGFLRSVREPSVDRLGHSGERQPPAESVVDSPAHTNTPMRCSTAVRRSRRRAARMRPSSRRSARTLLLRRS